MPRHPLVASTVSQVKGSLFSTLAERLTRFEGETFPLHVGDTWMEPAAGCRMEDLSVQSNPGMHRYAPPRGIAKLLELLVEEDRARTGLATNRSNLLVATGATGALGAVAGALFSPGDEILILGPHWPLISGIVRSFHGKPKIVPFFDRVEDAKQAVECVSAHLTAKTVALYVNTPNNPTGRVLSESILSALADWAASHDLWLLSDEVYERYVYEGRHIPLRSLKPERTLAAYSFSKAYGMAGNRCGYVVGPSRVINEVRKVSTHTFYSTPTASQLAAVQVLGESGQRWLENAVQQYRETGSRAAERLGVKRPDSGTFLFLDLREILDDRGLEGFLEQCLERGLLVAPGPSFGPFPDAIRICFTTLEPERTMRGIEQLASLLGR